MPQHARHVQILNVLFQPFSTMNKEERHAGTCEGGYKHTRQRQGRRIHSIRQLAFDIVVEMLIDMLMNDDLPLEVHIAHSYLYISFYGATVYALWITGIKTPTLKNVGDPSFSRTHNNIDFFHDIHTAMAYVGYRSWTLRVTFDHHFAVPLLTVILIRYWEPPLYSSYIGLQHFQACRFSPIADAILEPFGFYNADPSALYRSLPMTTAYHNDDSYTSRKDTLIGNKMVLIQDLES
ncbi:predicted protein [Lichtheimia corymbifera JMRC:FSU:9682]|uniref:Uncharacterized protein n=1 Tax=Lichtheimia corymbifera JMRC:FSU:9682 TaxID=1263082 RepID=A0A068S8S3_9FUNG|nr:predicted protein [Lichtheimia corymbifera JMRC:FSU:9682]